MPPDSMMDREQLICSLIWHLNPLLHRRVPLLTEQGLLSLPLVRHLAFVSVIDFTIDSGSTDRIQKLDNLSKKAVRRMEYCLHPRNRQNVEILMENYNIDSFRFRRKGNLVKIMYPQSSKYVDIPKSGAQH